MRYLILLLLPITTVAQKHLHKESYYQNAFANTIKGSKTELTLTDGTRCDIVTDSLSIEVDFANKWAEAVGQSLHYSLILNKKPGILLILELDSDIKYLHRLQFTAKKYGITVWVIDSNLKISYI